MFVDNDEDENDWNAFWMLLLFGMFFCPPLWVCGSFGLCSDRRNEKLAGCANVLALLTFSITISLVLFLLAA